MKTVIIFGATGGIGQRLVAGYLNAGFGISCVGRDAQLLANLQTKLIANNFPRERIHLIVLKQIAAKAIAMVFRQHHAYFSSNPDVVINLIAKQAPFGPLWTVDPETWLETNQINLHTAFLVTQTAIQDAVLYQQPCSIVHFSGGGAAYGRANFSAYGVSKTAILRLVETVALELAENNLANLVQINAVAPGAVLTSMTEAIIAAGIELVGKQAFMEAQAVIKSGGSLTEEIIKLCLFLSDREKNQEISGKLIHIRDSYATFAKAVNNTTQGLLRRVQFIKYAAKPTHLWQE